MNRDCNGDVFTFEGKRYYRCMLDGYVSSIGKKEKLTKCPHCAREISAHKDHGEPFQREVVVTEVWLEPFEWVEIERKPKAKWRDK